MALRFMEGFENRQHDNYFSRAYASYTGVAVTSVSAGRQFGGALRINQASTLVTRAVVSAVENTWILQFAIQKENATASFASSVPAIALQNSSGDQLELRFVDPAAPDVGGYQIQVRRGATVLATTRIFRGSSNPVLGWRIFQLKATIRTGVAGSFELRSFDGYGNMTVELGPTTGINTANQGVDGADRLRMTLATATAAFLTLDDVVLMDGTGSVNNNFTTAPVMVMGARPNADVAGELDWVPSSGVNHFALVQDGATLPAQTDEVTSDVVGDVDLYGCDQITLDLAPTVAPPTVLGIMVDVEGLMKTSGARTVRVRVKDSTNQADGAVDMVFNDTAKISRHEIMEQNPTGTPAPWTVATLKTIEMGPKLTA